MPFLVRISIVPSSISSSISNILKILSAPAIAFVSVVICDAIFIKGLVSESTSCVIETMVPNVIILSRTRFPPITAIIAEIIYENALVRGWITIP